MKFPLSWLLTHLDTDASLEEVTRALTAVGLEVEAVDDSMALLRPFVVAEVLEVCQHPNADRLRLCRVTTGSGKEIRVVCGAHNVRSGIKSVLATPGTIIPRTGITLKKSEIRGQLSEGMLCSAYEMCLSEDHDGIMELPDDASLGSPFASVLGLDDPVIEIAVTPNRADCLGVRGVARDLAAFGLGKLKPQKGHEVAGCFVSPIEVEIDNRLDHIACPLFVGRFIRGVKNGESPEWLRRWLTSIGQRPISLLVDLTNFFTFDVGRPLHVFDATKINGGIIVRSGRSGETFEALNGNVYTLSSGMTVVADCGKVLSLGGIIGGATSAVGPETVDIFIESAYFDHRITARTGRLLGVQSEARYRFERGVDPASVFSGMEAMTALVLELAGGEASDLVVAGSEPSWQRTVPFRYSRVADLAGLDLPAVDIRRILFQLGFGVPPISAQSGDGKPVMVGVPSWRVDIAYEADLVEEVVRIHGYGHIPSVPLMPIAGLALSPAQRRERIVRRVLAAEGFREAITFSFTARVRAKMFGGGEEVLRLINPISTDLEQMRPTPLATLVTAVARNLDREVGPVALMEVGPGFIGTSDVRRQKLIIAGVRAGYYAMRHWGEAMRAPSPFDTKRDVMTVLTFLGISEEIVAVCADEAPAWYHPGQSGVVKLGSKVIACFGTLHPEITAAHGIDRSVVAFEIFLDEVPLARNGRIRNRPFLKISPFQPVRRDFAFVVKDEVASDALIRAVKIVDKTLIKKVELFDVYCGDGLEAGMKSLAFTVTLQSADHTLTEAEIESLSAKVVYAVTVATGGTLRQ